MANGHKSKKFLRVNIRKNKKTKQVVLSAQYGALHSE